jgi:hypothetical protein
MRRTTIVAASCGIILLLCIYGLALRAQAPFNLSMVIDGGYAVILGKQGNITIGAFKAPNEAHNDAAHQMILALTRGAFVRGKAANGTTPLTWNLAGFDVEPAQYGTATGAVVLPSSSAQAPDCTAHPNDTILGGPANAMALLPNITTLGKSPVDTTASRYESRVMLAHGRLVLTRAIGCWEYRNGTGTVFGARQPLAAGTHALKYDLTIPDQTIELKLTKIGGGPTESIVVKPEWIEANKAWEVSFKVTRFTNRAETLQPNQPMKHFDRYYSLLKSSPAADQRILPFKQHTTTLTAPGDECSPGFFVDNNE